MSFYMDLGKEQRLKARLANVAKVIFVVFMLFKISELTYNWIQRKSSKTENGGQEIIQDSVISLQENTRSVLGSEPREAKPESNAKMSSSDAINKKQAITPNSVSIYIFNTTGLDAQIVNQLRMAYFNKHTIKSVSGFDKEQLLLGNLGSAAATEWVCVGTVNYQFSEKGTTYSCELSLQFDTYNQITGEIDPDFSSSMIHYGIGFSEQQAKGVAIGKVHP